MPIVAGSCTGNNLFCLTCSAVCVAAALNNWDCNSVNAHFHSKEHLKAKKLTATIPPYVKVRLQHSQLRGCCTVHGLSVVLHHITGWEDTQTAPRSPIKIYCVNWIKLTWRCIVCVFFHCALFVTVIIINLWPHGCHVSQGVAVQVQLCMESMSGGQQGTGEDRQMCFSVAWDNLSQWHCVLSRKKDTKTFAQYLSCQRPTQRPQPKVGVRTNVTVNSKHRRWEIHPKTDMKSFLRHTKEPRFFNHCQIWPCLRRKLRVCFLPKHLFETKSKAGTTAGPGPDWPQSTKND